ncbi:Malonate decarboxylase acyl carrier protein [compost metagenome]
MSMMQQLTYYYEATKPISQRVHIGVVGSGDLEIIFEPTTGKSAMVKIRTQIEGFEENWKYILDRFFKRNDIIANIEINDFGATPGVASLRLAQAIEVLDR